jgi:hypothetical protein
MSNTVEVCPNIGPRQRQRRLRLGVFGIASAIAWAAGLSVSNASLPVRTVVFMPLVLGTFGLFQYRAGTCVRLAASGRRNLDSGSERVSNPDELAAMRRQARIVYMQAIGTAAVLTALYLFAV